MNNLTLIKVLLAIFFFQNLSAQVPRDFEFLDHRARMVEHIDSKIFENQMVSVQRLSTWPMTNVTLINMDENSIDTILGTFWGQSDINEFSDGTFDIYVHSMFDYDICVSGFIHIAYDGSSFEVDTLHSYIIPDDSIDWNVYPISVVKSEEREYYMVSYDSLYVANGVKVTGLRNEDNDSRLFQNDARDVYIYNNQNISTLKDGIIDTILTLSDRIIEIKNNGPINEVLTVSSVETWNDDFSQLIKSWPLSEELPSFYYVHIGESLLTVLSADVELYKYYTVSETGEETILETGIYENEDVKGFHFVSDNAFVEIKNYQIQEIESEQLLYRHKVIGEEIEYQSRQVSIDSFSFSIFNIDTLDLYVNNEGDTLAWVSVAYDVDLQFTNNSDTDITFVNAQSSRVLNYNYFIDSGLNYSLNQPTAPNESVKLDTLFFNNTTTLQTATIGIPGADYRINNDPSRLLEADIILDTQEIVFDSNLKIFPNPASNLVNIESDQNIQELSIYNAQGQLVLLKSGYQSLNQIDVHDLNAGVYYIKVKLKDSKSYAVQQFVKI